VGFAATPWKTNRRRTRTTRTQLLCRIGRMNRAAPVTRFTFCRLSHQLVPPFRYQGYSNGEDMSVAKKVYIACELDICAT